MSKSTKSGQIIRYIVGNFFQNLDVSLDGRVSREAVLSVRQLCSLSLDRVVRHEVGEVHGGGGRHGGSRVEAHVTESRTGGVEITIR